MKNDKNVLSINNEFARYPYLDAEGRLTERAKYQLAKPFPVEDIMWLPTDVKRDGDNETAIALVYTDARTYHRRLDDVFGAANWGTTLTFLTTPYFKALPKKMGWGKDKDKVISEARDVTGNLVIAVVGLKVAGLLDKTSSSEEDASEGNAATSPEQRAFKRACSMLGVGRYFYEFGKVRLPYKYGKFQETPDIPDFAKPKPECSVEGLPIKPFTFVGSNGTEQTWSVDQIVGTSMQRFSVVYNGPLLVQKIKEQRAKATPKTETSEAA